MQPRDNSEAKALKVCLDITYLWEKDLRKDMNL